MKLAAMCAALALILNALSPRASRGGTFADSAVVVLRGHQVHVQAELHTTPLSTPCGEDEYWGGGAGTPPVVTGFAIAIDGRSIWLPRSSYADLANVTALRCESSGKRVSIVIQGGETATTYRAILGIEKRKVVSRRVHLIELPGSREDTRYHYEAVR